MSGFSAAGFAPVQDAFAQVLAEQPGTGAAMAAWHDGRWVADLWGGRADAADTPRWQADSIVQPYSVSKPFAAVCLLLLVDRGVVELDAPVRRYWPEFRPPATVRHLLSHQAGVVALDRSVPTEVFYDWDALCSMLADQEPCWAPGSSHGESALFYGHLLGEVSRRVDGRSPGRFLREEVCGPLGLDFQFGLSDAEQGRAVELTGLPEYVSIQRGERPDRFVLASDRQPARRSRPERGQQRGLASGRDTCDQRSRHRARCRRAVRGAAQRRVAVAHSPGRGDHRRSARASMP